jgi:hypothetical protein
VRLFPGPGVETAPGTAPEAIAVPAAANRGVIMEFSA